MVDHYPIFSIITPVFNREKVITKAIQSVLNQHFENWELIIIDDCSKDNTIDKIKSFEDKRIKCLTNSKNRGPAFSRNLGLKESKGEIISFLDSDDEYLPDFLKETYNAYKNSDSVHGFFWTGLKVKYLDGEKIEIWNPEINSSVYNTFLEDLRIGTNSGLSIKKEVFEKCGFFEENLRAAEDTELLLRIAQSYDFLVLEKPLIFIDKSGDDRLSKKYSKIAEAYNYFIPQHWECILNNPRLRKKFFYKMMWLNYHLPDYGKARKYFKMFIKDFNFSPKVYFVMLIFEIFGAKNGSKIHILLSR